MSTFPQLATHPGMNPAAVIQGDRWRIGIITESLVRSNGRTTASSKTTPPK